MVGANQNDSILERSLRVATDETAALEVLNGRDIIFIRRKVIEDDKLGFCWVMGKRNQ